MNKNKLYFVKKEDDSKFMVCRETPLGTQRITSCCSYDEAEETAHSYNLELIRYNKKLSELYEHIMQEGLEKEEKGGL